MNSSIQQVKNFNKKYTLADQKFLIDFSNGVITQDELYSKMNASILTQKTIGSIATRRHNFQGLLKNIFHLPIAPIEASVDVKQITYDHKNKSMDNQVVHLITREMFKELLQENLLLELLFCSGRRIGELVSNDYKVENNQLYMVLNKSTGEFRLIKTLCPVKDFVEKLQKIRNRHLDESTWTSKINLRMKGIIPPNFYKKSSHLMRSIYAMYLYTYKNPQSHPLPWIIKKYLNHQGDKSSAHYSHIELEEGIDQVYEDFLSGEKEVEEVEEEEREEEKDVEEKVEEEKKEVEEELDCKYCPEYKYTGSSSLKNALKKHRKTAIHQKNIEKLDIQYDCPTCKYNSKTRTPKAISKGLARHLKTEKHKANIQ